MRVSAAFLFFIIIAAPALADYKYTDRNGIIFWVDDRNKIPPEYQNQDQPAATSDNPKIDPKVTTDKPKSYTRISFVNNQIIVPVVFVNKGRKVAARMILDTGSSSTVIYPHLARKLAMDRNRVAAGYSKIADGSQVSTSMTRIDYIQVDDSVLQNPEVAIMSKMSDMGVDGLLGNSFLKYFHFMIDYEKQLIVWD